MYKKFWLGNISTRNGKFSETSRQVHLTRKQCLFNQDTSTCISQRHGQLSIDYQSYGSHTWPIKWNSFFSSSSRTNTAVWMHYMDTNKTYGEKAWQQLQKNAVSNIEQVLVAATITKTIQVRWTKHVGHCWRSRDELICDILL